MEDWTVNKALRNAEKEMDALNIPRFNMDLTPREDLDYSNLMNVENSQLEIFLTMYGGYKAYIETELADQEAIVGALEASFVEDYSIAHFKVGILLILFLPKSSVNIRPPRTLIGLPFSI